MSTFQTAEKTGYLASQTSIDELKADISDAQAYLDATSTSADGKDVAVGTRWATQEAKDAFQAAINAAQAVLDNENATQNDIEAALKDLAAAQSAFQDACHDGTMISSGASEDNNNDSGSSDKNAGLAQTGELHYFNPEDMLYVKARGKYCTVECVQNSVPLNRLLGDMENMLGGTFIRVHRSYLVNAAHIVSVKRYELTLTNGDVLPIPKQRYAQVRREIALRIAE